MACLTLVLYSAFATAAGMPDQISSQYLIEQGFIPFQEQPGEFPPIYASISVNGTPIYDSNSPTIRGLFADKALARIPESTVINKSFDSQGREVWNYPVGTEVAHEISFKDDRHTLFELRFVKKVSDHEWDFASFSPGESAQPTLIRNHYTGLGTLSATLRMTDGSQSKIDLKRINLMSCKNCHFTQPSGYQYPTYDDTGPCGFTPLNVQGIQSWIDTFQTRYGHSPFYSSQ